ncbi:MAG: hypothetical protein R3335_01270 [Anaerolineales bacterium]|nr:hypothetical protein [Anaerolineales bacterium]
MIIRNGFEQAIAADNPNVRITNILLYIFNALQDDQAFWELFYSLRSQPAVMAVLGDDFRSWTGELLDLLTVNLREAGWAEPEVEALVLFSLIEGTILQYLLDPSSYPLDTIVGRILERYSKGP